MIRVDLYQDAAGQFHYEFRQVGVPRSRHTPCGLDTRALRAAAWFAIGDERGRHHYDHACAECRAALTI